MNNNNNNNNNNKKDNKSNISSITDPILTEIFNGRVINDDNLKATE